MPSYAEAPIKGREWPKAALTLAAMDVAGFFVMAGFFLAAAVALAAAAAQVSTSSSGLSPALPLLMLCLAAATLVVALTAKPRG